MWHKYCCCCLSWEKKKEDSEEKREKRKNKRERFLQSCIELGLEYEVQDCSVSVLCVCACVRVCVRACMRACGVFVCVVCVCVRGGVVLVSIQLIKGHDNQCITMLSISSLLFVIIVALQSERLGSQFTYTQDYELQNCSSVCEYLINIY